jgi:hypothetical protein
MLSVLAKNANVNPSANVSLPFHGTSYRNFINAIKSPATKLAYETSLKRLNHIKKTGTDELLVNTEPRYIES